MSRRSSVIRREVRQQSGQTGPGRDSSEVRQRNTRYLVPWLLLFAGSGCAALIYEIVWFQLLQLVIGSSAVSLGLLLAAYMGGLCLGSAALRAGWFPRGTIPCACTRFWSWGSRRSGSSRCSASPWSDASMLRARPSGLLGLVLRGAVAAVCLLPPTLLMGASLPAIARWVETTRKGVSRLGSPL